MIALYLLPVFIIAQSYVVSWLLKWLRACWPFFEKRAAKVTVIVLYFLCTLAMYIAPLFPHGKVEKFFRVLGYYWYGVTVYIVCVMAVVLLGRFIVRHSGLKNKAWASSKRTFVITGAVSILAIVAVCVGGHYNAKILRTTEYEVNIPKDCDLSELNMVLIADLHLGYNIGPEMMEQMVEKVNACDPDVIVIAGDVFDNCYTNIEEPEKCIEILQGMKSRYGTFVTLGNHDCEEEIVGGFTFGPAGHKAASDGMYDFVERAGFTLLCDESVLLADCVNLYGRPDEERPGKYVEGMRRTPEELMETMDSSKPVIVVEHEPKELGELAGAGIDLHLAGHTHDGQLFPLTIGTGIMWENPAGLLKKGDMISIVTSGVGLYGPYIRVGTIPEICNIHVTFSR